jgi:hydroxymethylpyrimidine pyrophosphatase-like HAD family hydrolase
MDNKLPKTVLIFDLDGTLTIKNQDKILPDKLVLLLNQLDDIGHYVILCTGKPVKHVSDLFIKNNLDDMGIIAENAGSYRKTGESEIKVIGHGVEEIIFLRKLIGLDENSGNVIDILIDNKKYQVAIEPDNVSSLTIFTNPDFVSNRWSFEKSIDPNYLFNELNRIIENNHLDSKLFVIKPFSDGAVQVIRKDEKNNLPIDKSFFIHAIKEMYPDCGDIHMAMFGDSHNDIPAMMVEKVIPMTFSNSDQEVIDFVRSKKGHVSIYEAPNGFGVSEGILWLANQGFFGEDKDKVINIILNIFPNFK